MRAQLYKVHQARKKADPKLANWDEFAWRCLQQLHKVPEAERNTRIALPMVKEFNRESLARTGKTAADLEREARAAAQGAQPGA